MRVACLCFGWERRQCRRGSDRAKEGPHKKLPTIQVLHHWVVHGFTSLILVRVSSPARRTRSTAAAPVCVSRSVGNLRLVPGSRLKWARLDLASIYLIEKSDPVLEWEARPLRSFEKGQLR